MTLAIRQYNRPGFIYSHSRHNEVNLNLGLRRQPINRSLRGNLALMTGTYANATWQQSRSVLKNIFEANGV